MWKCNDTVLKKSALNNILNYLWKSKYNFSVTCNKMYNNINVKTIDVTGYKAII